MAKIGTLSYDINGNDNLKKILEDDKKLAISLKEVLSSFKLNANTNTISAALNKSNESIKSINSEAQKLGTIDLTSNINKMLARLTEIKSEMSVYKQLMLETSNISKKLEIKSNLSAVEKEAASLMRQIQALDNAERGLNKKGNNKQSYYSMSDESSLKQMSTYYKELEMITAKTAREEAKLALEAAKVTKEKEKAANIAMKNSMKEEATQAKLAANEIKKAAKEKEAYARAQEKAMAAVDRERIKQESLNKSSTLTNKTMFSQNNLLGQLSQAAGIYFSIYQVGSFIKSLYQVSGEFEKQKVSLAAILQNTDQAGVLFERIKSLAVKSPFQFSELVSYTKQLSAFSVPYNELYDTTKRLADVSAGLGMDMSRLVLAYGQVRSASVLRGQELRQFTEAGIPMVDELAKKFTKLTGEATSAGDVFDKISRRQVPFEMVKEIFTELTSEGGKFYMMQEQQAETLSGKLSNLKDSYQIMLNAIGEGNSGIMKDSVNMLTNLMNHWEDIARILKTLVVAYGTYKAVLISVTALEKVNVAIQGTQRAMALVNLVRVTNGLTAATYSQVAAQRVLNATMSINPVYIFAAALAALVGGIVLFSEKTKTAEETQAELYKAMIAQQEAIEQQNASVKELIKTATDLNKNTVERQKALNTLNGIMPSVFKNLSLERIAVLGVSGAYNEYNKKMQDSIRIGAKANFISAQNRVGQLQREFDIMKSQNQTNPVDFKYDVSLENKLDLAKKEVEFYKKQNIEQDQLYNTQKKFNNEQAGWRGEVNKLRQSIKETDIAWGEQEGFSEYAKKIREGYNTASTALKEFSKTNKFSSKEYASNKQQMDDYAKVAAKLGINLKEAKKTHVAGAITDKIYERIKRQINAIDDAKTAYDKYLKKVSSSDASKIIKEQTGVDFSKSSAEDHLKNIDTSGMLSKNALSTKNMIAELTIKYNKEDTVDNLKIALDASLKYVNDNKKKYNIYKSLLYSTGDESLSSIVAFGDGKKMVSTYLEYVKDLFKTQAGISFDDFIKLDDKDKKKSLVNEYTSFLYEQINDESNSQREKDLEMYADMLSDFAGFNDKKAAIEYEYREKIRVAEEAGNLDLAKKLKTSLSSELQKITPDYNKFFTSIYSLTKTKAIDIGNEIKKNLKDQLDKGVISANEYYESIKKINEQLELSSKGIDYFGKLQSGGIGGLLEGITEQSSSDYQSSLTDLESAADTYKQAMEMGDKKTQSIAAGNMNSASSSMGAAKGMQAFASKASTAISAVDQIVTAIDQSVKATQQLVDGFAELAESRGVDTNSGKWAEIKGLMSTMSAVNEKAKASWDSAKSGDIAGAVANAVGIVTSGLTAINKWHDQKYNKIIANSVKEVKKLQTAYENLNDYLERQLGGITTDQASKSVENLKAQQAELVKQMNAENAKKKTDADAIADYKDQIYDLGETIKYYYEDLFSEEYSSTIKDWASSISSALVDAFSNGTDAAEAFDTSVSDIVKGLAKRMIQLQFIEPAMKSIRTYLFGDNGVFNDGSLSTNDMSGLIDRFSSLKDTMGDAQTAWNAIAEAAKKNGIDIGEASSASKSGITANVQSLTEDTGNILASYINAIRADLSVVRSMLDGSNSKGIYNQMYAIMQAYYPNVVNTLALQQAELVKIQNNTLRSADSNDGILNAIEEVRSTLKKATTAGSGTKLNV